MNIVGMLRVKNESRWIERVIGSILPICQSVLVMDDHSDDGTSFRCSSIPGVTVFDSPFAGLDETRDKNWLLGRAKELAPDWIIAIDGDEMLSPGKQGALLEAMRGDATSISMRVAYLWDDERHVRMDGVYGEFRRHSAFRPNGHVFTSQTAGGFHCGNVPYRARLSATTIDAPLLHFGYLEAADRERKYCWYNAQDPANHAEDRYRHIAAGLRTPHGELIATQRWMRLRSGLPLLAPGELLPAAPLTTEQTMHAGPVRLEAC